MCVREYPSQYYDAKINLINKTTTKRFYLLTSEKNYLKVLHGRRFFLGRESRYNQVVIKTRSHFLRYKMSCCNQNKIMN